MNELMEGYETPHGMELQATVHWVVTENAQARTDVSLVIREVHALNERKARVFPEHYVRVPFGQLTRLNLAYLVLWMFRSDASAFSAVRSGELVGLIGGTVALRGASPKCVPTPRPEARMGG